MTPVLATIGIIGLLLFSYFALRLLAKKICHWIEHAVEGRFLYVIGFAGWAVIVAVIISGIWTLFYLFSLLQ